MLCELADAVGGSFLGIYAALNAIMIVSIFISSSTTFYYLYWPSMVTYDKWKYKSNPAYPSPEKVRDEIYQTIKGLLCASVCPALSIYLARTGPMGGISLAFCGWGDFPLSYHVGSIVFTLVTSDLYEFLYHRLGHIDFKFWQQHKHHHVFYNPSPFSVIADEWVDQFFRSIPLLIFPLIMPVNIDALFAMYGFCFYFYGVYLHSGYEVEGLSAHNRWLNTSFQHYCHHAKSLMNKPYHCGFFVKLWDKMFDCTYPEEKCFCAECCRAKGERTEEAFNKVVIPDYSRLFSPQLWLDLWSSDPKKARVKAQ